MASISARRAGRRACIQLWLRARVWLFGGRKRRTECLVRCSCRSAHGCRFLHEIKSSAPVSLVPRRTRTLTKTVRRPARPALHRTLHRPESQVSGARAAAVRGSRGSRLLPRCHQRTPWRRHRCRPCRPLSPLGRAGVGAGGPVLQRLASFRVDLALLLPKPPLCLRKLALLGLLDLVTGRHGGEGEVVRWDENRVQ